MKADASLPPRSPVWFAARLCVPLSQARFLNPRPVDVEKNDSKGVSHTSQKPSNFGRITKLDSNKLGLNDNKMM